jgi:tRNA nucleotidyltransferase/poly(A) polymerase
MLRDAAGGHALALMKFLSQVSKRLGVGEFAYVVGGAVRNHLMGLPPKDIDVVFDSVGAGGKDSEWFAKKVQGEIPVRTSLITNQYGVAILTLAEPWTIEVGVTLPKGETIEIANARKESYSDDPSSPGKGYKPHMVEPATIKEDTIRREFRVNTLMWRLIDLEEGPEHAKVLDPTGHGLEDLKDRVLRTPQDPDKTFSDDPTRMLRAIKFVAKYGFKIAPEVHASIQRNAPKLKAMPWEATYALLTGDILEGPAPRRSIELMKELGLADVVKEMLVENPGFAAALGRSLSATETHLLLDLLDMGWSMKTPLSFLSPEQQTRVREVLLSYDEANGKDFIEALKKPPIDQPKLFAKYSIPPKERGNVNNLARQLIIEDPSLVWGWGGLEQALEAKLSKTYGPSLAEKVAARFVERASSDKQ